MAKQVFASEDLKRHIFSFGYPEHREFMKSLKKILHVDCKPFMRRYARNHNWRVMNQYILHEYTETEILRYIHYYNRCRCCTRHSHFKPILKNVDGMIHIYENDNNIPGHVMIRDHSCQCHCRYLMRQMTDAYSDIKKFRVKKINESQSMFFAYLDSLPF